MTYGLTFGTWLGSTIRSTCSLCGPTSLQKSTPAAQLNSTKIKRFQQQDVTAGIFNHLLWSSIRRADLSKSEPGIDRSTYCVAFFIHRLQPMLCSITSVDSSRFPNKRALFLPCRPHSLYLVTSVLPLPPRDFHFWKAMAPKKTQKEHQDHGHFPSEPFLVSFLWSLF